MAYTEYYTQAAGKHLHTTKRNTKPPPSLLFTTPSDSKFSLSHVALRSLLLEDPRNWDLDIVFHSFDPPPFI